MSTITAKDVNSLRQQTGAGMMDCKKALVEANGDFEKAIDFLRKQGQKVAAKRSDRDANEGFILAKSNTQGNSGVIVSVNCETDFVAKNDDFVKFANTIAEVALNSKAKTKEEVLGLKYNNDITVGDKIIEQVGVIGEKIELSSYGLIESDVVFAYNHPGNRIASLVGLNKKVNGADEVVKDIAMQIAAMAPLAIDQDGISKDLIEKEIEIGKEQARTEGKPEEMLEKIALGKLNKFYKESTLLNQQFIKDNKKSVKDYLKEKDTELTVTDFKRFALD